MRSELDFDSIYKIDEYPSLLRIISPLDRHMSVFRRFVGQLTDCGTDMMAMEFMKTALPPVLTEGSCSSVFTLNPECST